MFYLIEKVGHEFAYRKSLLGRGRREGELNHSYSKTVLNKRWTNNLIIS